jgi:hypothetical protein
VSICVYLWAIKKLLCRRFRRHDTRSFFGFTRGNLGLQDAILGAAVDLLLAKPVEARGVATCFGHDFLFS